MNLLNRAGMVVLFVVLAAVGLLIAATPDLLLARLQAWTGDAVIAPQDRILSALLGALIVAISTLVLYVEMRRKPHRTVVVSRMSDGTTELEVSSVALRLRQAIEAIAGVRQVTALVSAKGQTIEVRLVVTTATEVDVPAKSEEISAVVRDTAVRMGVTLGRQQISFRYEPGAAKPAKTQ